MSQSSLPVNELTKTIIACATRWGSQFGGINTFNQDLLHAVAAHSNYIHVVCVVYKATAEEIESAKSRKIQLISLNCNDSEQGSAIAQIAINAISEAGISIKPCDTVWLGHDRITGEIALAAAKKHGSRCAVVHHMSYRHYEDFAENSTTATEKIKQQERIFKEAHVVFSVGPLLREALEDMLDCSSIPMLIPGLPDIKVKSTFRTFRAFISGRLSQDAKKVKQGHLGVAAFAHAVYRADTEDALPECLRGANEPELTLRGIDFEKDHATDHSAAEIDLRCFAEQHAHRAIRMRTLPFTTDRSELFEDLRSACVAMMPSWHEGFGLVGWEAIAAGVPLILSKKSGVYRLLNEDDSALFPRLVWPIDVMGSNTDPFFKPEDQSSLVGALIQIAKAPEIARANASRLREALANKYTWSNSANTLIETLGWKDNTRQLYGTHIVNTPQSSTQPPTSTSSNSVLHLPSPNWQAQLGLSSSWLLRAEEEIIPFDSNRESFLAEQIRWAKEPSYPVAIRLLTGVGGTGKTRLALELCKRLQVEGWEAGFLGSDTNSKDVIQCLSRIERQVCIAIDYAETRQEQLLDLISEILKQQCQPRVRILLLARDSGNWWEMLPSKRNNCEALLLGMATSGPFPLPSLHVTLRSRQQAYEHAMVAFSTKLAAQPALGFPKLDDEYFAHPLYVQMAALLALHGEQPDSAEAVARALIGHERRYWSMTLAANLGTAPGNMPDAALLMTLATLSNGITTIREAEKLWVSVNGDRAIIKPLFSALAQLYPGHQGLEGLRPDLLGEALVAQCLLGDHGNTVLSAVLGGQDERRRHASLTVIARLLRHREDLAPIIEQALVQHFARCVKTLQAVIIETPSLLPYVVERAFTQLPKRLKDQVCGLLNQPDLHEIIPLIDLSALVRQARLEQIAQKSNKKSLDQQSERAIALGMLDLSFNAQGRLDEAASVVEQALTIHKKLAKDQPKRFEPDLATSLNNYANRLGALGRTDEAVSVAKWALDILERLAQDEPDQFESAWASSLNNYANQLGDLGKIREAASLAKRALDINERLAKTKPERFEPQWANSLNNYANRLSELGSIENAVSIAAQALDIYERLAQAKPERFEPDWANALGNYASHLSELGRIDDAASIAKKALDIRERLAKAKPERFEPDWATSLSNYANHLSDLDCIDNAASIAKQALDIYERLAKAKPKRFEPHWANSLSNYAIRLSDLGRIDDAVSIATQALDIHKRLVNSRPDRFEPDWAHSLSNYAIHLSDLGRIENAASTAKLALNIYERLAKTKPERFEFHREFSKIQCTVYSWLSDGDLQNIPNKPSNSVVSPRQQLFLDFLSFSILVFINSEVAVVAEALRSCESCWRLMDKAQRHGAKPTALLIAGISDNLGIANSLNERLREEFKEFARQRQGHLPWWMMEIARRKGLDLTIL